MSNNPWELPPPEPHNSDDWALQPDAGSENRPGPAEPETSQFNPQRTQQASLTASPGKKKFNFNGKVLAIVAVVVLVIAGGTAAYFVTGGGKSLAAMSYISTEDPGPDPFMDSTVNTDAAPSPDNSYLVNTSLQGAVAGDNPNIYGGTGELSVCDAAALVTNLKNNSDLNAAFAEGIGINAGDVPRYVNSLSPVILRQDTWVTNHGYDNGHAVPFQAVLQRGTAVMVDAYGVPRVRCSCGNPLAEAWNGYTAPETAKANWDGYEPRNVVTIYQTDVTINTINVINVDNGVSNEIGIADDDSATQQQVLAAVTDDTPVTTPKDMGVRPDGKLLGELGLTEADGDSAERPAGGDRFSDYQQWAETGFGGAGENGSEDSNDSTGLEGTTPVDSAEFEQQVGPEFLGNYYIEIENRGVGCFVNTETNGIFCYVDSLANSGKRGPLSPIDGSTPDGDGPLNFLVFGGPPGGFTASAFMLESPLNGINPDRRLRPGESVTIGDYTCFNLEDTMGCTAPVTRFDMDPNGDIYIDRSEVPINR